MMLCHVFSPSEEIEYCSSDNMDEIHIGLQLLLLLLLLFIFFVHEDPTITIVIQE